jgi:signal transduction histidine kinase
VKAGDDFAKDGSASPVLALKLLGSVGAFFPWCLWLLKESIGAQEHLPKKLIKNSIPWLIGGLFVAIFALTDFFIPSDSRPNNPKRGVFYFFYGIAGAVAYIYLLWQIIRRLKVQTGIHRVEMQFIALNLAVTGFLYNVVAFSRAYLPNEALRTLSPIITIIAYALTAWGIAFHRIFDARQIFMHLGQRAALVTTLILGILGLRRFGETFLPPPIDIFLAMALCSWFALWLDRKSRDWLGLDGEGAMAEFRGAVMAIARVEPDPAQLLEKFQSLLCDRCQTTSATILFDRGTTYGAGKFEFTKASPRYATLCQMGWATPESLQRRRPTEGVNCLREFLVQNSLGVLITAPHGSPTPSLLLGVSTKCSRWPYTYPEVQRLQNVAELMDNILTHAHLTAQAALKAKLEHLALMSRGLAHDLKNLITPVATFITHEEGRFTITSPEGEVHAAAKRSVRIMNDYVREALFFASRLTPKFEQADLAKTFETVRELTSPRAAHRNVKIVLGSAQPVAITADVVLLQRLLVNLVNNAIDASDPGAVVNISCLARDSGLIRIEVADQGCGIATENLRRIFDPYFTTKQFGDDIRGFGLGLTICEKIVDLHQGTILVRSELGHGTSVVVDLPAAPSAFGPRIEDTVPS